MTRIEELASLAQIIMHQTNRSRPVTKFDVLHAIAIVGPTMDADEAECLAARDALKERYGLH